MSVTKTKKIEKFAYAGQKGESIINKMRKTINNVIPNNNNTKVQTIYYNTKKKKII